MARAAYWFRENVLTVSVAAELRKIRAFCPLVVSLCFFSNCSKSSGGTAEQPIYGLLPVNVHGFLPTRDNITINVWSTAKWNYIANTVYDTVFSLNINHRGTGTEPVPYTTDTLRYKDTLDDIVSSIQSAAFYTIENEEQHFNGDVYHSEGITAYCNELKAAAHVFSSSQVFTNGGYTSPAEYWYYAKTHDEDFKTKIIPNVVITSVQNQIDSTDYEMNVIRTLPSNFINNVHIYLTHSYEVEPLLRMCDYIKEFTHHEVLSNEAGIYRDDPGLISDLMTLGIAAGMRFMIFYSGDGSGPAYPITVEQILAAQNQH